MSKNAIKQVYFTELLAKSLWRFSSEQLVLKNWVRAIDFEYYTLDLGKCVLVMLRGPSGNIWGQHPAHKAFSLQATPRAEQDPRTFGQLAVSRPAEASQDQPRPAKLAQASPEYQPRPARAVDAR